MAAHSKHGVATVTLTQMGVTKLRIRATSQSGAIAYSDVASVILDNTPTLVFDPPLPSRIRVRGVLPIRFKVADTEKDNIQFTLYDNGTSLVSGSIDRDAFINFDWWPAEGEHNITMRLSDGMLTTALLQGPVVTVIPYRNIHDT